MRVVVNELMALGLRAGIGHYTAELLRCLRQQAPADQIDAFPQGWLRRCKLAYAGARAAKPASTAPAGQLPAPRSPKTAARGWVLDQLRRWGRLAAGWSFRSFCARGRYQLYHEPNYVPLSSDLPTVVTVCDLSVLLHPQWHPADRVAYFERHFQRGLARCQHVLAISEFGRQEIIRTLYVPPERVTCTYLGIRPDLRPLSEAEVAPVLRRLGLPPRYLLCLGTIEPRKNVLTLLRAYCALPAALRERWPLVLAGAWGWNTEAVADYFHAEARHRGVLHLGYVADAHLAAVYNGARALVYPSRYEGFGLPPLEMMACGGAVLASTAEALAETVGGQAHLVHPEDVDGWRAALARVLTDDNWWRALRQGAMAHARRFTWDRCAEETWAVYRTVLGQGMDRRGTRPLAA
jgi:alpha-1,3-rhamnosyl/mannosyltransferase